MFNFHSRPARLILLVLLIWVSPAVFALGLGNAKVESFLNQPLNARIDLLVRPGEDISAVTAKLASAEDYALIGASRDAISVPLRFTVDTQTDQPFVRVTSNLPVNHPIVRLIIELNWPSGRLLREYTLFLDPPTVAASAPPPIIDQRRQPPATSVPQSEVAVKNIESSDSEPVTEVAKPDSTASTEATSEMEGQFSEDDEYGPVQSGETLWRIASNWSAGSGAGVNQVMLAIQRNNPQAFINNNINLLKRGAILRMPSTSDIEAISVRAAQLEVQEQTQLFAANSDKEQAPRPNPQSNATAVETPLVDVASEMSSSTTPADSSANDAAQLEIVPPSEDSSADSAYGAQDSVENSSASTSVAALQEELARKEEALITEQQTNEYLQQRIKELESLQGISDTTDIQVQDEELAGMEARLRDQRLNADAEGDSVTQPAAPASTIPKVVSPPGSAEKPWYSRWTTWVIGLLVLIAAGFGWYRSRNGAEEFELAAAAANDKTVRGIKDDAEEILKVLKPNAEPDVDESMASKAGDNDATSNTDEGTESAQKPASQYNQIRHLDHEEAHVLDEDSADPEVRLDLARAYISMGDREAARAILGEVIEHGDEAQQAEAKSMLGGL